MVFKIQVATETLSVHCCCLSWLTLVSSYYKTVNNSLTVLLGMCENSREVLEGAFPLANLLHIYFFSFSLWE